MFFSSGCGSPSLITQRKRRTCIMSYFSMSSSGIDANTSKGFKETFGGNQFLGGNCSVEISKPSKQAAESCRLTSISHMLWEASQSVLLATSRSTEERNTPCQFQDPQCKNPPCREVVCRDEYCNLEHPSRDNVEGSI